MKWQEIREKYPESWVIIQVIKSHLIDKDNKKIEIIDDFEMLKVLKSNEEFREAFKSREGIMYNTQNETLEFEVNYNFTIFKRE